MNSIIKHIIYVILSSIILFCSCKKNNSSIVQKIVKEWTGKEIQFPPNLECMTKDSVIDCLETSTANYKILLYVDSLGCTSCRTKLVEWKKLISETDTLFEDKLDFLFVFQPKYRGLKEFKILLKNNGFDYPVFVDVKNEIMRLNNFPKEPEYQCFLLDEENKVVMVGNPVLNPAIWELYKKIIREDSLP